MSEGPPAGPHRPPTSPDLLEAAEREPLAREMEQGADRPLGARTIARRGLVVTIAGVALYLVLPRIVEVFSSFPLLRTLDPFWATWAIVAQIVSHLCTFVLQRMALRTKAWLSVVTSQLAGNAITAIVPGGAAAGAAMQFRMLSVAGMDTGTAVGGLTAFSLIGIGSLLALPLFVLPVIFGGAPVNRGLSQAAVIGVAGFLLFAGLGAAVLVTDRPLRLAGHVVHVLHNRLLVHRAPLQGVGDRLLRERNLVRSVLGTKWKQATLAATGRLAFDFLTLLFALRSVGSHPDPSLVLLAFAIAGVIGMLPITPGGLGLVEAGLAGLLVLAGVPTGSAVLATLAYRLISYWLPLLAGPVAYLVFKRRYGSARRPPSGASSVTPVPR